VRAEEGCDECSGTDGAAAAMNAVGLETAAGPPWLLFDLVGSGVAVTTPDGTLEFCNAALRQLLRQDAKGLLGASIFNLLDGSANNELEKLHRTALATSKELRTQVRSSSGRFVASAVMRRSDSLDGLRVIWSFVDARCNEPAAELAKSARALEHSESRFAHAVWGTSVGFWDHDIATDTVYWWNDWCASVDLDPCDGPDHSARWDLNVHPDELLNFDRRYQALLEGRSDSYESEYRMRTRSGSWRWIMSRGRATARDALGRTVRMAGVAIDIDARKRMELALRDSEARLEAAIWGADVPR
jgi:PAS domain-containing protein